MKQVYTFTDRERAYVEAAKAEVLRRLRNVAEIAGIQGSVLEAPDGSGFVEQDQV